MTEPDLPALTPGPLAPRAGEWNAIRARARRSAHRRTAAVSVALALAAGGPALAVGLSLSDDELDRVQPPVAGGDVRTVDPAQLSREHVTGDLDYPGQDAAPPVGGAHAPVPQTCGTYAEPVQDEHAVHSLEHGAVWLTYRPDLDATDVQQLRETVAGAGAYGLLSPRQQDPPVVATAWGHQLTVDDADDPRLEQFVRQYANGPQTPEPGALCDGTLGFQLVENASDSTPPCDGTTAGFDILTTGRADGTTPESAAAAYATRPGNGASFPLPSGPWTLLVQTADVARVVSGPVTLHLFRAQDGWAVDGGSRCEPA